MSERRAAFVPSPHCVTNAQVRVRFCETDLMGVVHHQHYIAYFELARIEYLRRRGVHYSSWVELGVHLPVVETAVRYRKPAFLDDLLTIETRLAQLTRVKARFEYRVLRPAQSNEAELLAEGHTVLVCVDAKRSVRRIPTEAAELLLRPEISAGEVSR